ncbi:MAG: putative epoxide hydrolase [Pseudonocardiales bacterium]|nr:putative epoxide hydrolase [Pseudonocardiales bacterium]
MTSSPDVCGRPIPAPVHISDHVLDDLRLRLERTRWPDELPDAGDRYGVPLAHVGLLVDHWLHRYDWRVHEARINSFGPCGITIDSQFVHFLHVRSPEPDALPLLITHGWPGSIAEFLDVISPLTDPRRHGADPRDAFHVVVPSIPGFGFSGPTTETGWSPTRVSRAWRALMSELGYPRYGVQGGDFGSRISRELGRIAPGHVTGVHLNFLVTVPEGDIAEQDAEQRVAVQRHKHFQSEMSGYVRLQSTRPQTIAYSLNDSPTGLLAWIAERFLEWSDPDCVITPDTILTNVMLYWATGTAGSAARLYWEMTHAPEDLEIKPSTTPTGVALFPYEIAPLVRALAERTNNIVHWSPQAHGGHFAALEAPDLFVADVRAFFRALR